MRTGHVDKEQIRARQKTDQDEHNGRIAYMRCSRKIRCGCVQCSKIKYMKTSNIGHVDMYCDEVIAQ